MKRHLIILGLIGAAIGFMAVTPFTATSPPAVRTVVEPQYLTQPPPSTATEGLPAVDNAGRYLQGLSIAVQGRPDAGLETDGGLEQNNALAGGVFECYRYQPELLAGVALPNMGIDISAKAWTIDRDLQFDCTGRCDGGQQATYLGYKAVSGLTQGQRISCKAKALAVLFTDGGPIVYVKTQGLYQ